MNLAVPCIWNRRFLFFKNSSLAFFFFFSFFIALKLLVIVFLFILLYSNKWSDLPFSKLLQYLVSFRKYLWEKKWDSLIRDKELGFEYWTWRPSAFGIRGLCSLRIPLWLIFLIVLHLQFNNNSFLNLVSYSCSFTLTPVSRKSNTRQDN